MKHAASNSIGFFLMSRFVEGTIHNSLLDVDTGFLATRRGRRGGGVYMGREAFARSNGTIGHIERLLGSPVQDLAADGLSYIHVKNSTCSSEKKMSTAKAIGSSPKPRRR